jgi:hypothetical protein
MGNLARILKFCCTAALLAITSEKQTKHKPFNTHFQEIGLDEIIVTSVTSFARLSEGRCYGFVALSSHRHPKSPSHGAKTVVGC